MKTVLHPIPSSDTRTLVVREIGLDDVDGVCAYQRLRYDSFVLDKGWVAPQVDHPFREIDRYDPFCHHIGVFSGNNLWGYLRLLPWHSTPGFMLEHDFRNLIPEAAMPGLCRPDIVEASRLVVAPPEGASRAAITNIAEMLFRAAYVLGKDNGWTGYCIVLEVAWLRVLNSRFKLQFAPLGPPRQYPDGTRTLAAFASRETLEWSLLATEPDKLRWYQEAFDLSHDENG